MSKKNLHPKWKVIQEFSNHKIDLGREVKNHPELLEILAKYPGDELFELLLAEVATYCGIILDGEYTSLDIDNICKLLVEKLVSKRTGIVFSREVIKH